MEDDIRSQQLGVGGVAARILPGLPPTTAEMPPATGIPTTSRPQPMMRIGPIGSRGDTCTISFGNKSVWIQTGCFAGTLEDFKEAVEEKYPALTQHGKTYRAMIIFIKAVQDSAKL